MSQLEKFKARILKKPSCRDITSKELQSFLLLYGFVLKRVKGDHFIYEHPKLKMPISVPMPKIIKPAYIDKIRDIIMKIDEV